MNKLDREYLRHLQDRVIEQSLQNGFALTDNAGIADSSGKIITLNDLKQYLYPQFQKLFEDCLS